MSQLRNTLIDIQKEKTLRLLLGSEYEMATVEHKKNLLSMVDDQIQIDVDKLLRDHIHAHQASSPEVKKDNKLKWIYVSANIVLTSANAYAINQEEWIFWSVSSILIVLNQALPFVYDNR